MPDYKKAQDLAQKVIEENFVNEAPVRITEIAQNYSYKVIEFDFSKFTTINGFIDPIGKRIGVDQTAQENVKAFIIAQYLGLALLMGDRVQVGSEKDQLWTVPKHPLGDTENLSSMVPGFPDGIFEEVDWFAANILIPQKLLEKYISEDINSLAKIFGVPVEVIGYRMQKHE